MKVLNLIASFISVIGNQYYISTQMTDNHKEYTLDAIDYFNQYDCLYSSLQISNFYKSDDVRISYYDLNDPKYRYSGSTIFTNPQQIKINRNIDDRETFTGVILHELGHTRGLQHNDISGSIMNLSVTIISEVVQPLGYQPKLGITDVINLYFMDNI